MADIFDVVADETRRDILRVLLERSDDVSTGDEISVSEIVARLELSQPTVSKHLKVLRGAGLVQVREEGQHRYYRLDSTPLEAVEDWVMPFLGPQPDAAEIVEGLTEEARTFANSVGKVFADTSHRVSSVVGLVSQKKRQRD